MKTHRDNQKHTHTQTGKMLPPSIKSIWCFMLLLPLPIPITLADRLLDKMYSSLDGSVCFRRLNATHSTGCGSSHGGSVGALHLIQTADDFEFLWNKPPAPPYTLIIPPHHFTRENILQVTRKASQYIAGIVLIENGTRVDHFSHELKCPNPNSAVPDQACTAVPANQSDITWNPFGTGLLHENFPFPIIYVKDAEHVQKLIKCYWEFNGYDMKNQHRRRLCSIQIKSFMSAAVNSEVCIRRTKYMNNMNPQRYCDPLQSKNVWSTLFPRPMENRSEPLIMVTARIDTTSMFDGIGVGALDSLVPAVTLMSTAHTLSQILPNEITRKFNVLFMLFNGEAYDYIGSQRFVYDLINHEFPADSPSPIRLEDIKLLIDIGSLDSPNATTLYQYTDFPEADSLATVFRESIEKHNFNVNVTRETTTKNLPPTSSQSFLREHPEFPAVIFYSNTNKNRFYHSIYDNETNIGFVYRNTSEDFMNLVDLGKSLDRYNLTSGSIQLAIRNVSSALTFSLFEMITGKKYPSQLGANPYLIDEMLHCYLQSAKCPLFMAAVKDPKAISVQSVPPHRYVSVLGSLSYETVGWTYRVLGYLTGRPQPNVNQDNCNELPLAWFAGINGTGQCFYTTQNLSNAYSPAFIIDNYDWHSGRYSTWTESTWSEITIRIFLKPALSQEAFTLAIGLGVLLLSFVFVYIINNKSDVLLGESTSSINVLTLPAQC